MSPNLTKLELKGATTLLVFAPKELGDVVCTLCVVAVSPGLGSVPVRTQNRSLVLIFVCTGKCQTIVWNVCSRKLFQHQHSTACAQESFGARVTWKLVAFKKLDLHQTIFCQGCRAKVVACGANTSNLLRDLNQKPVLRYQECRQIRSAPSTSTTPVARTTKGLDFLPPKSAGGCTSAKVKFQGTEICLKQFS